MTRMHGIDLMSLNNGDNGSNQWQNSSNNFVGSRLLSQLARRENWHFWIILPIDAACFDNVRKILSRLLGGTCLLWTLEVDVEQTELFAVITICNEKMDFFFQKSFIFVYLHITGSPFKAIHETPCNVAFDAATILHGIKHSI